jgi:hypothetical protein
VHGIRPQRRSIKRVWQDEERNTGEGVTVKLQTLPPNWITWRRYGELIIARWMRYSEYPVFGFAGEAVRGIFSLLAETVCFVLSLPLLATALITSTVDLIVVTGKKIMGRV